MADSTTHTDSEPILTLEGLEAGYGRRRVLHDVTLNVKRGEIVTILGHNGAGKTTLLKATFGMVRVRSGKVVFNDRDITNQSNVQSVKQGLSLTLAEAPVFRDLTVWENLELGAFTVRDAAVKAQRLERLLDFSPLFGQARTQVAGTLSGGQQRLLSLGIALMGGPQLMLLDEPSVGLAPVLVQGIFELIKTFSTEEGLSVLLVEQNVRAVLPIADRAYFMRAGHVILEESAEKALARGTWWDLF